MAKVIVWSLYFVGCAVVFGSWVGVVSPGVGWIGWVIGMVGWILTFTPWARGEWIDERLARLAAQHRTGQLTDEEFAAAKAQILDRGKR